MPGSDPRGGHAHRPRGGWTPGPDPDLRISDADRAEVTDALCAHFAEGRLTEAEFTERAAAAAAARTGRDLTPLMADLPRRATPTSAAGPPARRPWRWMLAGLLLVWILAAAAVHRAAGAVGHLGGPWGPPPVGALVVVAVLAWLVLRRRRRAHRH